MKKIISVDSIRSGNFAFTFDDGERLSFFFCAGSYTENHMKLLPENGVWKSTTVEVYGAEGDRINHYLKRRYGETPAPKVPVNDIPSIINDLVHEEE